MRRAQIRIALCCCLAGCSLAAAAILAAAQTRKPGLWEMTTEMTWQHSPMPANMPAPPNGNSPFGGGTPCKPGVPHASHDRSLWRAGSAVIARQLPGVECGEVEPQHDRGDGLLRTDERKSHDGVSLE